MGHRFEGDRPGNPAVDEDVASGTSGTGITRRRALQAGAVAVGTLAFDATAAHAETHETPWNRGRYERSFDDEWLFFRGDVTGAEAASFDDSSWRKLDLPHDWGIEDLPYATSDDGGATAYPSLLTTRPSPPDPSVPQIIGPFDLQQSAGGGATAYTVGGIGWYRKHFDLSGPRMPRPWVGRLGRTATRRASLRRRL